ncbi:MAG: AI-2E family transporter [Betaproteobacteria bacterium]|nr:AI-2E family transporter [Betaproteobacteria bacterium]
MSDPNTVTGGRPPLRYDIAAWLIVALGLVFALSGHLLPALLAGLLVYELVRVLAPRLPYGRAHGERARQVAIGVLAISVVAVLSAGVFASVAFLRNEPDSLPALLAKMADIIEGSRGMLPDWLLNSIPVDPEAIKEIVGEWLREHAGEVRTLGGEAGRAVAHVLIGMVIGAAVSLHEARAARSVAPLARALVERCARLGEAFRRVVFAQVRIAALNAAFTAVYLVVVLPLLGIHLPFAKTMVAVTFVAGLLPVIGNLISNTVIVVISLANSFAVAIGSLVFLVVIHKLEYFLNARIVGSRINAAIWELLLAMLAMEAAFGIAGLVAAPVYYAYFKDELSARGLI